MSLPATSLRFRLLNVFTVGQDPFSGNPLCVFEDSAGLSSEVMQALARQFNLSETTFVTMPVGDGSVDDGAVSASVRIFTPSIELPFAGHPTLGTALVVSELSGGRRDLVLRMRAADVPVSASGNRWTLRAKPPVTAAVEASTSELAAMLGVEASAVLEGACWVDTGVEQLLVPLRRAADVRSAQADPQLLQRIGVRSVGEALVYVWAPSGLPPSLDDSVEARLFFTQNGAVVEDPATGSACANLGGWFHSRGGRGLRIRVHQGEMVHRPSLLELEVDSQGAIYVSGSVLPIGEGVLRLRR